MPKPNNNSAAEFRLEDSYAGYAYINLRYLLGFGIWLASREKPASIYIRDILPMLAFILSNPWLKIPGNAAFAQLYTFINLYKNVTPAALIGAATTLAIDLGGGAFLQNRWNQLTEEQKNTHLWKSCFAVTRIMTLEGGQLAGRYVERRIKNRNIPQVKPHPAPAPAPAPIGRSSVTQAALDWAAEQYAKARDFKQQNFDTIRQYVKKNFDIGYYKVKIGEEKDYARNPDDATRRIINAPPGTKIKFKNKHDHTCNTWTSENTKGIIGSASFYDTQEENSKKYYDAVKTRADNELAAQASLTQRALKAVPASAKAVVAGLNRLDHLPTLLRQTLSNALAVVTDGIYSSADAVWNWCFGNPSHPNDIDNTVEPHPRQNNDPLPPTEDPVTAPEAASSTVSTPGGSRPASTEPILQAPTEEEPAELNEAESEAASSPSAEFSEIESGSDVVSSLASTPRSSGVSSPTFFAAAAPAEPVPSEAEAVPSIPSAEVFPRRLRDFDCSPSKIRKNLVSPRKIAHSLWLASNSQDLRAQFFSWAAANGEEHFASEVNAESKKFQY